MKKITKRLLVCLAGLIIIYMLLLIPDSDKTSINAATQKPFAWNKHSPWNQLEDNFTKAKKEDKSTVDSNIQFLFGEEEKLFKKIQAPGIAAADTSFKLILNNFFSLAPLVSVQQQQRDSFI